MTFSICVREEVDDGAVFGVAVTTDAPAVGALAPFTSNRGAVSTQAFVNVRLGRTGIRLLEEVPLSEALSGVIARDDHSELRQLHGVDETDVFAHTGEDTDDWAGHETYPEEGVTVAGNILEGPAALSAAADSIIDSETADNPDAGLALRLIDALEAGTDVGGDKRGHSSAAIDIAAPQTTAYHDLRVDYHDDPIAEIRRVYQAAFDASDGFSEDSKERIFD